MKKETRHTIYNSIGLGIAALVCLSFAGHLVRFTLSGRLTPVAGIQVLADLLIISCIGGGAMLNMLRHRFSTRPTIAMIVVYFMTIVFAPLAIWGIVELHWESERRRGRSKSNHTPEPLDIVERPTTPFSYKAAKISWICAVIGFVSFVFAVLLHLKIITYFLIPIVVFSMIFSLILGIIALFGIRKYGPNRILIPALVGTIISSTSVLFIIAGIAVGLAEGLKEKHKQGETTNNAHQQTGTISQQQ